MYPISGFSLRAITVAACCLVVLAGERTVGQTLRGAAAFGSWHDDRPGVRRLLTLQDLSSVAKATYGEAHVVPMPSGARPQVPQGFSAELVTPELRNARVIRVAPNGDLFFASGKPTGEYIERR